MAKPELTKRQSEILDFITGYIKDRGYSPSYREIGESLGVSSTATVHEHVKNLEDKGYLRSSDGGRSIEVDRSVMTLTRAVRLPLAGLITAGEPIEALQEEEEVEVPRNLAEGGDCYVLEVKGDSMIEDGIFSGDYVIVERNPAPRNGEIVVALLENTFATLKRFYREKGRIRLQPANAKLRPIYVKDVTVQGVVKGLIRDFK